MKFLCSLVAVETPSGVRTLAISPGDDVFFVSDADANPELRAFVSKALDPATMACIGHMCVAEGWTPSKSDSDSGANTDPQAAS